MHATGAIPGWPCTGATSDRLVVTETFDNVIGSGLITPEAKGEIVTVALGGGTGLEAAKNNVRNPLTLNGELAPGYAKRYVPIDHTVRTLPPTTAALSDGERNDLGGIRTSTGLRQP